MTEDLTDFAGLGHMKDPSLAGSSIYRRASLREESQSTHCHGEDDPSSPLFVVGSASSFWAISRYPYQMLRTVAFKQDDLTPTSP